MTPVDSFEVLFDDRSIDVSKETAMVWSIANTLRGKYTSDKYKDVIIPMVIIRRFECALAPTKAAVLDLFASDPDPPDQIVFSVSGYPFFNHSGFTLRKLLDDPDNIDTNLKEYIAGFSSNIQKILAMLNFSTEIDKMDKSNRLYGVIQKFSELDMDPKIIDSMKMGYIFEDIIRRFSENAEAGDHYTPREVIRLMTNVLLAEGCDDILTETGKVVTVLDAACGTGGMLSTSYNFIHRKNPGADVRLFGQEINPESYAICLADMLIKGQDIENIVGNEEGNTLKHDCFPDRKMRLVIMNPPFGTPWGGKDAPSGQESAVKAENKEGGRFEHGLPAKTDSQLLFMQHAISKLEKNGRAAIIANGSPLFSGSTTSGESQIRRWMLETDVVEAIISLTGQLFYNTDIGIYIFILSKNKRPERKGFVQLINATDLWKPLKKSLGKKRREIDRSSMSEIVRIYSDFKESDRCKIIPVNEFLYAEYSTYQPLRRSAVLDKGAVERLRTSEYFNGLYNEEDLQELEAAVPRNPKQEKAYQKIIANRRMVGQILDILAANLSDVHYDDFSLFKKHVSKILNGVDGISAIVKDHVALELSVNDPSAVLQYDSKGRAQVDKSTRDSEIVRLSQNLDEYLESEVYKFAPDTIVDTDEATVRRGAEFPFSRYFYTYVPPRPSEEIESEIRKLELELDETLRGLFD